ncbi:MAG TPA: hypothetical protein PLH97_03535, partial [Verrucomicrobiota bacterium]|nr:hypothetical protein [Verrucomicrobiota bacterium]
MKQRENLRQSSWLEKAGVELRLAIGDWREHSTCPERDLQVASRASAQGRRNSDSGVGMQAPLNGARLCPALRDQSQ